MRKHPGRLLLSYKSEVRNSDFFNSELKPDGINYIANLIDMRIELVINLRM